MKNMPPFIKTVLFGLGVFAIFTTLAIILKLVTNHTPVEGEYFGLFTNSDIMLGLVVAIVVTLSHERKKKLK
jgi:hypothetical protein